MMRTYLSLAMAFLVCSSHLFAQGTTAAARRTYSVYGTVRVGASPTSALTASGGVWIANYGGSTISVIDSQRLKVLSTINVGRAPYAMARMTRYEDKPAAAVYITNQRDNTVSVYDEYAQKVTATIPVGRTPHGVATTVPATSKAYIANAGDNSVTVVNQRTLKVVTTITKGIGRFPTAVAARWDSATMRSYVYVANTGGGTVSVIDASTDTVVSTISTFINYPIGLAAIQSLRRVFFTNQKINTVTEVDALTHKVLSTFTVGAEPIGVAIKPIAGNGSSSPFDVFVANSADDTVTVLQRDERNNSQQVQTVRVGKGPFGIDASSDSICVTNYKDGTVTVLK